MTLGGEQVGRWCFGLTQNAPRFSTWGHCPNIVRVLLRGCLFLPSNAEHINGDLILYSFVFFTFDDKNVA